MNPELPRIVTPHTVIEIRTARIWADFYRERGYNPLPSRPDEKRPLVRWSRWLDRGIPAPPVTLETARRPTITTRRDHPLNSTTEPTPASPARPTPAAVEALTYGMNDLPAVLGVSRRLIEGERAAGRFPRPDLRMGRRPLWRRTTIERWLAVGGGKP